MPEMDKRATSKIFVGGLSWETTDQRLRTYFENYGAVSEAFVSFDRTTGRPRGFGFVVFEDASVADKVVSAQHTIDRREVEAKKAVPKEDHPVGKQPTTGSSSQRTKKIFVGGLAPSVDEQAFRKYFEQYGAVEDAVVMYDHDNKRPRGFGFVTFVAEEGVDAVFTGGSLQTLHDKPIEIKRAVPRDQIATARGRPNFASSPRLFSQGQVAGTLSPAQSGFAAAAMGPAFDDGNSLANNLLASHSLGASLQGSHALSMAAAPSLGNMYSHDLGAMSQGLAAGILSAMSGQLNGLHNPSAAQHLAGQLSGQLSMPPVGNSFASMSTAQMGRAGSTNLGMASANSQQLQRMASQQLQQMGSQQLQQMGSQQLQQMGSQQLPRMGSQQLGAQQGQQGGSAMGGLNMQRHGSSQLQSTSSGLLQGTYGGLQNGMSGGGVGGGGRTSLDILGADYARMQQAQQVGGQLYPPTNNSFAPPANTSGFESAFAGMALDRQHSSASELPPAGAFEERVNMLSAGSAGLGQLPSPKLTTAFSASYPKDTFPEQRLGSNATHELPPQQW